MRSNVGLMLKIDMHVHTRHSDSTGSVEEVLETAQRKGLDGIAITDHKTLKGAYEALQNRGSLIVIPGEEIKTTKGEILVLGIKKAIPEHLTIIEALKRTHTQGGLAVIPHPTVPLFSNLREKDLRTLPIDGLEVFSAITPLPWHFLRKNLELARRLGLSITAGSDSHNPETVGDAYTIVYSESRDLKAVLHAIRLGRTSLGGGSSKALFKLRMIRELFTHLLKDRSNVNEVF
ncbi:MAG: CehA/McbA family metallohydrolase [Candidatus Bathyarchaeota archaeon]|nr:CehA/McbA family metallohydrolase [Candidatus Bathyarchaeota archaeon]